MLKLPVALIQTLFRGNNSKESSLRLRVVDAVNATTSQTLIMFLAVSVSDFCDHSFLSLKIMFMELFCQLCKPSIKGQLLS